jgi:hypothetical protein
MNVQCLGRRFDLGHTVPAFEYVQKGDDVR